MTPLRRAMPVPALVRTAVLFALQCIAAHARASVQLSAEVDPLPVGVPVRLDVRIVDEGQVAVPWEDLAVHHARKVHVYAVHEVRGARTRAL